MRKSIVKYITLIANILLFFTLPDWKVTYAKEQAEDVLTYKELLIQLMPEYVTPTGWDEEGPAVLYGQHGLFVNEEDEPYDGTFSVSIPVDDPTFQLALVGHFDGEGIVEEEYTVNEETKTVEWKPKEPVQPGEEYRFVVEYYYGPLSSEVNKQFTFEQQLDAHVENFSVLFFEPFEAENVQLSAEPNRVMDMYGTPVHLFEKTNMAKGETFQLNISYDKESDITTIEALEMQMPDDAIHQGMGEGSNSGALMSNESVVMLSISIIVAGLFLYLGLRNRRAKESIDNQVVEEKKVSKKGRKFDVETEKKRLRQQFVDGQIDEETYRKKMSILS